MSHDYLGERCDDAFTQFTRAAARKPVLFWNRVRRPAVFQCHSGIGCAVLLHHMLPQTSPSEPSRCIVHAVHAVGGPLATRLRGAPLK